MIPANVTKYLQLTLRDAGMVELRTLPEAKSQRFTEVTPLTEAVQAAEQRGQDCYCTLNRPGHPCGSTNVALKDADITVITRLPFDFDPIRFGPATEHHIALAESRRKKMRSMLSTMHWPDAVLIHSGNGVHAVYRTHMPANLETKLLLARLYRVLDARYSDDRVRLDPTVRNASRILRVPGSINQKSGRRATITSISHAWDVVTTEMIEHVLRACELPDNVIPIERSRGRITGAGDYSTLDVIAWLASHGLAHFGFFVRRFDKESRQCKMLL